MGERDVLDPVGLVDLDPEQLRVARVLDVMACPSSQLAFLVSMSRAEQVLTAVVGEDGRVACCEVEGAGLLVADEDCSFGASPVEVEPLFSLQH